MSVSDQPTTHRESTSRPGPNARVTLVRNGIIGGVVAVLLSFLPLSTVVGGGAAGYLDRGVGRHGSGAGAIAGLVAFVPYAVIGLYIALSPTFTPPGPELGIPPWILVAGTATFALVYVVGSSVLGGLLGGLVYEVRRR